MGAESALSRALPAGAAAPLVLAGVLGLLVGSFLNVVIHRLPRGESVVSPGSHCPRCNRGIRWYENVPLLSWILLGGRCRGCRARISLRYPAVEALTGALFAAVVARHGLDLVTPAWWAFVSLLVAAAAIDLDHQIIPDELSLGGLAAGLVLLPVLRAASGWAYTGALLQAALGALVGGGLLWLVGFLHARLAAARGRRFPHWPGEDGAYPRPASADYWTWFPGLGFGDVKLLAMIGAFVGPAAVIEVILAASLVGLVFGLAWAAATRSWSAPFGFGPAIAAGALLVLLVPLPLHLIAP
jgi:leader peptidase (prepilin peptidase)/N-methyltransferase